MTLDVASLATSLTQLFTGVAGHPATPAAAGDAWASRYATYARAATATSLPPTVITTRPLSASVDAATLPLASALGAAFSARGSLVELATAMAGALAAFWQSIGFALEGATGVTVPPITPPLIAQLATFFAPAAGPRPGGEVQATNLAAVLDAWTRTIAVSNTAGPLLAIATLA